MTVPHHPWSKAVRALAAVAVDPGGLKGIRLRARVGPLRYKFEELLHHLEGPSRRIHPDLSDAQLFGSLDVSASLQRQKLVYQTGLASAACSLVLPMAERTSPGLAARLSQLLDANRNHSLILLDEGAESEEQAPASLRERLAFDADLGGIRYLDTPSNMPTAEEIRHARLQLDRVVSDPKMIAQFTAVAAQFGIKSLRAPWFAVRTARAFAALGNRMTPSDEDIQEAAEQVFGHRAMYLPSEPDEEPIQDNQDQVPNTSDSEDGREGEGVLDDVIVAAIAAQVPKNILELANSNPPGRSMFRGSGAGERRRGNRRGRPLPSRPGRLDGHARIDLIATLRSAAPFQTLRQKKDAPNPRIVIYPSDIRLKRYEDKSDRLLIFSVDASGSAAMARMAEAKGAVELMLAQAYSKRDQVALIAFRGEGAEVLLPPTRSLVQAKRRLASLPGGGGTPLAAGLIAAIEMADLGRMHGLAPSLILLTDGRANVDLQGNGGRDQAKLDAKMTSVQFSQLRLPSVVIDTAARAGNEGKVLADWLGSHYLALPRADAERISAAANAALEA